MGRHGDPATLPDLGHVLVDDDARPADQLRAIAVQASLLGAGSLDADVIESLPRRAAVVRRYLAIEGHRALVVQEAFLPLSARGLIERAIAGRSDLPAT